MLERVMSDEQVVPGEAVLSSGGDQIFPKGLPVGTVSKVGPGKDLFLSIKVKPAADLSRLEEVLVVTQKQEREPVAQSGASVRAADILAQRLPSVPDKPATVAAPAAAGNAGAKPQPNAAAKPAAAPVAKLVVEAGSGIGCRQRRNRHRAVGERRASEESCAEASSGGSPRVAGPAAPP